MATQSRLSHHNKFISAENITILSVSSDDYLHASLSLQSSKCGCYSSYSEDKIKEKKKKKKRIKNVIRMKLKGG